MRRKVRAGPVISRLQPGVVRVRIPPCSAPPPPPPPPPNPSPQQVTQILEALGAGDRAAAGDLLPLVYEELRKLAQARMSHEHAQTLQPTALVHEAYLRLVGEADRKQWDNRGHFFGAAAQAMRRIMVERARHRNRIKHGGGLERVNLDNADVGSEINPETTDLVGLDEALNRLQGINPRRAEIVLLRYFGGLSVEETARAMQLSPSTVKNEWTLARAWLHRELSKAADAGDGA
jgi:RNA polymerase sigma factor (TIGR02999 family)